MGKTRQKVGMEKGGSRWKRAKGRLKEQREKSGAEL